MARYDVYFPCPAPRNRKNDGKEQALAVYILSHKLYDSKLLSLVYVSHVYNPRKCLVSAFQIPQGKAWEIHSYIHHFKHCFRIADGCYMVACIHSIYGFGQRREAYSKSFFGEFLQTLRSEALFYFLYFRNTRRYSRASFFGKAEKKKCEVLWVAFYSAVHSCNSKPDK